MQSVFLCGPLSHAPLLAAILGTAPSLIPAGIADWAGQSVDRPGHFALVRRDGATVNGVTLLDVTPDIVARLDFYAKAVGLEQRTVTMLHETVPERAVTFALEATVRTGPWDADLWLANHAALAVETATQLMVSFGQIPPARLHARLGPIMVRADSRLRARAETAPHTTRRPPERVAEQARREPYAHFFAVEEYDLSFRRFDGTMSPVITRAAFVSADAVTVLPYDPQRDRILLVEQMRTGPFGRGDGNPWQLEAIAGRIDPGETPEDCARREASEEAGLTLGTLLPVANYYPSPGAKTEFIYSYVAQTDLPDGAAGVFGVEDEAEDIRGHLVNFDQAMALIATGEIQNAPVVLTLFWLQHERARLRA